MFFIQNESALSLSYTKSIPVPSGIFFRNINPAARVSSVEAISARIETDAPSEVFIVRFFRGRFLFSFIGAFLAHEKFARQNNAAETNIIF